MWRYSTDSTDLGDGLAVRHLRLADGGDDAELALHAVDEDLEVQLAHAGDHGLAGLFVGANAEGRVLVAERLEGLAQLVLVVLGLRLDGHVDDGLGEDHPLEDDGVAAIAQRVAGGGVLEAETGDDVAGHGDVEVFALVGVHQQDAAEALAAFLGRVVDLVALVDLAAVDTEVGQLAERVGDDLERRARRTARRPTACGRGSLPRGCGLVPWVGGMSSGLGRKSMTASSIGWTPLFLNAEPHRIGTKSNASVPARSATLISSSVTSSPAEVLLHEVVVAGGDGLEQQLAVLGGLIVHVGGDLDLVPLGAELFVVPDERLHLDQVDQPDERLVGFGATGTNGKVDDGRRGLQAILDHGDGAVEVGADAVHLVDEAHARDLVLVGLTPHGLGLRLDAGDRVEHGDSAVEDAQRPLDFDGEVDVAGGVDDVDAVVVPDARRGCGGDGDAALLLLRHVVHGRGAVVDLADLVALAGVVEDALGRGGLARVDVGHDADIAGAL